jgi:hypothetical protein
MAVQITGARGMIETFVRAMRNAAAAWLFAAALVWTAAAAAQAPLTCTPANRGQDVCQSGNICRCIYDSGGTMTREPAGFRWDCGSLLYGRCPPGSANAALNMSVMPGPGMAPPGGASGGPVRAAQAELGRLGYNPGPIDGVIGPRTAGAIRAFQRAQRLPETGSLTPETLGRLRIAG